MANCLRQAGNTPVTSRKDVVVQVHAAAYVADDIVFTKNGAMYTQPWILMPLDDMVAIYSIPYPADRPLKVHYYRRKAL